MNTIWPCTGLKNTLTEIVLYTQVIRRVHLYIDLTNVYLLQLPYPVNFQLPKVEVRVGVGILPRIRSFSGIRRNGSTSWRYFWRSKTRVCPFSLCRSELSVEKTSVLQSELQSCNQLQELEPLNKCKGFELHYVHIALCSSQKYIILNFAAACLGRVLTDHYTFDEGTGPSGIWKGDTCSFPNIESKYPPLREHGADEKSNKSLTEFSPSGSRFHAFCILQWPVQQVYDWKHHPENGVCWSARFQYFWQGRFRII